MSARANPGGASRTAGLARRSHDAEGEGSARSEIPAPNSRGFRRGCGHVTRCPALTADPRPTRPAKSAGPAPVNSWTDCKSRVRMTEPYTSIERLRAPAIPYECACALPTSVDKGQIKYTTKCYDRTLIDTLGCSTGRTTAASKRAPGTERPAQVSSSPPRAKLLGKCACASFLARSVASCARTVGALYLR